MLLSLPDFEYRSCGTVEEACALLAARRGEARVLAGGTDVLVKMKQRRITPRSLINIKKIPGLDSIAYDEKEGLRIGALATVQSIRDSSVVMRRFTALGQAAGVLGTPHVRNLATLGGNLCNASPAAECAPALLTLGARARATSPRGERMIPLDKFFVGPGKSLLEDDEILTEIEVPSLPPHTLGIHLKHGSRRVDVAVAGLSLVVTFDGDLCMDARMALSAVGPTPFRAKGAEAVLKGQRLEGGVIEEAARAAAAESIPIDDIRGRAGQRRRLVEGLVRDAIARLASRARQ